MSATTSNYNYTINYPNLTNPTKAYDSTMPILHIVLFEFKPTTTHAQVEDVRRRLTAYNTSFRGPKQGTTQDQLGLTFLAGLQTHDRPSREMHAPNPQRAVHEIARRRPRQQPRGPAGSSYPLFSRFQWWEDLRLLKSLLTFSFSFIRERSPTALFASFRMPRIGSISRFHHVVLSILIEE
jgi:hypothetical protein